MTKEAAKLAATLMLIRDGANGIEVFMVKRHHKIDFATGAMVFPGGKLDPNDSDPTLRCFCRGEEKFDDQALSIAIAGVREAFEECGVLFAEARGEQSFIDPARLHQLAPWASKIHSGTASLLEFLQQEELMLALDKMVPFAHWVTPAHMKKRFDTYFFLAAAPSEQALSHDGIESVDSDWVSPKEIIEQADNNLVKLVFATRLNLEKLSRSASVAEALQNARQTDVVRVQPELASNQDGIRTLVIPETAGYGGTHFDISDIPSS